LARIRHDQSRRACGLFGLTRRAVGKISHALSAELSHIGNQGGALARRTPTPALGLSLTARPSARRPALVTAGHRRAIVMARAATIRLAYSGRWCLSRIIEYFTLRSRRARTRPASTSPGCSELGRDMSYVPMWGSGTRGAVCLRRKPYVEQRVVDRVVLAVLFSLRTCQLDLALLEACAEVGEQMCS
jgi:hypothetical protein